MKSATRGAFVLKEGDIIITHSPVKKVPVDGKKLKKRKTDKRNGEKTRRTEYSERQRKKNRRSDYSKRQRGNNRRTEYRQSYTRQKIIFSPRYREFCTEKTISDDNTTPKSIPTSNNATPKLIPTTTNVTEKSVPNTNNATIKLIPITTNVTEKSVPNTNIATAKLIPTIIMLNSEDSVDDDSHEHHEHREDEQKSLKNVTFLEPLRDAPPSEYSYVSESWASVANTISFDQEDFEAFLLQEHEKGNLTESSYIFMNRGDEDSETSVVFCSPLDPFNSRKSDPNFFGNIEGFEFFDVLDFEDMNIQKIINTEDDDSIKETEEGTLEPSESVDETDEGSLEQAESVNVIVEGKLEHSESAMETVEENLEYSESAMETIEVKLEEGEPRENADGTDGLVISRTECPPKKEARKQDAEPATSNAVRRNGKKGVGCINDSKARVRASRKDGSIRKNGKSATKPPKRFLARLQKKKENQIVVEIADEIDAVEICTNTTSNVNNTSPKVDEAEVCKDAQDDEGNVNNNYNIVKMNSLLRAVASLKLSLERYDQKIKSESDEGANSAAAVDAASYGENEISEDNIAETPTASLLIRTSDEIVDRIQSGLLFLQSSLERCSEIFTPNLCNGTDWELNGEDDGTNSVAGLFSGNTSDEC